MPTSSGMQDRAKRFLASPSYQTSPDTSRTLLIREREPGRPIATRGPWFRMNSREWRRWSGPIFPMERYTTYRILDAWPNMQAYYIYERNANGVIKRNSTRHRWLWFWKFRLQLRVWVWKPFRSKYYGGR